MADAGVIPKLKYALGTKVVPGDLLGRLTVPSVGSNPIRVRLRPGPGTYAQGNEIFASTVGVLQVLDVEAVAPSAKSPAPPQATVSVAPSSGCRFKFADQVIRKDQVVLARVVRLTTQQVVVEIMANEKGMLEKYQFAEGCIRREDIKTAVQQAASSETVVTPTATTKVLTQSFRPGDFVVARVLSLGDPRRYFLSTAEPALGVIYARSAVSGQPMMAVSWKEMECPSTGQKEPRKCAKPQSLPKELLPSLGSMDVDETR